MAFYHQKRFKMSMKKLIAIEDTLKELGISTMYHKMHTCSKLIVIGWIMHSIVLNFCDMIWWKIFNGTISWGLLVSFIRNHGIHINMLADLLFTFLLWFVQYYYVYICIYMCNVYDCVN
ncbi:uncharacterized protein LOC120358466 [Solenopsis invicta]|uniref:uncharacterized protein LOC120358466 n=1 Tax=Solenopsis invicta TaxID=13686 RepID=UPI00193C99A0|nr:uncharacterized protein LOC120358466 [Solenopsis invicta]